MLKTPNQGKRTLVSRTFDPSPKSVGRYGKNNFVYLGIFLWAGGSVVGWELRVSFQALPR